MKHLDLSGGTVAEIVREPEVRTLSRRRVILDVDLAALFGLPVRELRRQASRNGERFLPGWRIRLTAREKRALGIRARERAIAVTPHGLAALAMVLRTARAAEWSVQIVRGLAGGDRGL